MSLDGRVSASYVRVPVAHGHASVPNLALHLHAGLGYQQQPSAAHAEVAAP
jgi:aspartate-semialdehyde dehydrogenase